MLCVFRLKMMWVCILDAFNKKRRRKKDFIRRWPIRSNQANNWSISINWKIAFCVFLLFLKYAFCDLGVSIDYTFSLKQYHAYDPWILLAFDHKRNIVQPVQLNTQFILFPPVVFVTFLPSLCSRWNADSDTSPRIHSGTLPHSGK